MEKIFSDEIDLLPIEKTKWALVISLKNPEPCDSLISVSLSKIKILFELPMKCFFGISRCGEILKIFIYFLRKILLM